MCSMACAAYITGRFTPDLRDHRVAQVRDDLHDPEDPERAAETEAVREDPAQERSERSALTWPMVMVATPTSKSPKPTCTRNGRVSAWVRLSDSL